MKSDKEIRKQIAELVRLGDDLNKGYKDRRRKTCALLRKNANTMQSMLDELTAAREQIEQLQVQLAGCSLAALDCDPESSRAKEGDYGWSVAYQDVMNLRDNYNAAREVCEVVRKHHACQLPEHCSLSLCKALANYQKVKGDE